ncbi:MAG: hypothetical protein IEMM0008_0806 [bacterium]|nr:MAG: hypothetical protein IEMM0008_0806 [bacterium]
MKKALAKNVQKKAQKQYKLFKENPYHSSLDFKKIQRNKTYHSISISENWRAIGVEKEDTIIWFWIGSHEEYNKLMNQL